ncbi:MAG TPA: YIP1 family protein [Bacteroidales bacterium]|nr:YIP1 family protein [Bacteroidales bacterium]
MMDFRKLLTRSRNLIVAPDNEFERIRLERQSISLINKSYVIPVAIVIAGLSLIGTTLSNFSTPINSFIYIFLDAIILFTIIFTHSYLSGNIIAMLGKNMAQKNEMHFFYALSAYAQLPFFIALAIIKLFPSLAFIIIMGLYTGVLLSKGSGKLTRVPADKQLQFTLLSMLIMISIFVITSELFTMLYSEILNLFTTFAAQ